MPTTHAERLRLGGAALALLLAAACGGGGDDDAAADEPPVRERTDVDASADRADTTEEAILAGYRAGWEAFVEAMDPPNPDHPALAATSTGRALQETRRYLAEIRDRGNVLRGDMDLSPEILEHTDDTAVLEDCVQDSAAEVPAASPEVAGTPTPVGWEVHMVLVDGTWKQDVLFEEEAVCDGR